MANVKFPPTMEIKRAIAAATRAGIEIGSVEIEPRKITVHPKDPKDSRTPAEIAYSEWKASEKELARRITPEDGQFDVLPRKPKR